MTKNFGNEAVLRLMKSNLKLSTLDQVEANLEVIAGPVANWYGAKQHRTDSYLEAVLYAFKAMREDFTDNDAITIGRFLNVMIAGAQ